MKPKVAVRKGGAKIIGGIRALTPEGIMTPLPPAVFLIEQILPRASVVILGGFGGGLKTFLALDAALAVDSGGEWLGHRCAEGRAIYLAWEGGWHDLQRRLLKTPAWAWP